MFIVETSSYDLLIPKISTDDKHQICWINKLAVIPAVRSAFWPEPKWITGVETSSDWQTSDQMCSPTAVIQCFTFNICISDISCVGLRVRSVNIWCVLDLMLHWICWPFIRFIDWTAEDMMNKQDEREGEWHAAKGAQAGTRTRGRCSEDKASAHGTPALPTEPGGTP